jgi:tetratricopeptide (TPR) repeat protein
MSGWMLAAQVASGIISLSKIHHQRQQMEGAAQEIGSVIDGITDLATRGPMLTQLAGLVSQTPTTGDMIGIGINTLGNILQAHSAYKERQTEREEAATARAQMEHFERVRMQREQLRQQLAEHREDSMAAFERAEPLLKRERYIEAAEFYHTAIENLKKSIQEGRSERSSVNDMLADNYVKMGFACYQAGMYCRAAESLQEGIKLRPGDSNIHTFLGMSYCKLEKYEKAITHFGQSLQQNKLHLTYAYLYYARGMKAKKEGDVIAANKWFDKTIKTLDENVFAEGMHSSELYLIKSSALLGITITDVATDIDNQRRRLAVKAIRSYTESLKLLSTEAKYSIAREEIFVLRAQAYAYLARLPLEFSVRTPLFSGDNKPTRRPCAADRRRHYFFGRSVAAGESHGEAQYEPEREPEDLTDASDEEVTIRVPTSTTETRFRLVYTQEDMIKSALKDARAAFILNPYSQAALEILKDHGNAAERIQAEENLVLDDYDIAQNFEKGDWGDQDWRRSVRYYERAIHKYVNMQKLDGTLEEERKRSAFRAQLGILKPYAEEAVDYSGCFLPHYSIYACQELRNKAFLDKQRLVALDRRLNLGKKELILIERREKLLDESGVLFVQSCELFAKDSYEAALSSIDRSLRLLVELGRLGLKDCTKERDVFNFRELVLFIKASILIKQNILSGETSAEMRHKIITLTNKALAYYANIPDEIVGNKSKKDYCYIFLMSGLFSYGLGAYEEAFIYLGDIPDDIEETEKLWLILRIKCDCLFHKGLYDDAISYCDTILEKVPDVIEDKEFWNTKGMYLLIMGQFNLALQACDRALTIDPKDTSALNVKAYALLFAKQFEESNRCFEESLHINAGLAKTIQGKGLVEFNMGHKEIAYNYFQQAEECYHIDDLREVTSQMNLYHVRGLVLESFGVLAEAKKSYQKALSIKADYVPILNRLQVLRAREAAQESSQAAASSAPSARM